MLQKLKELAARLKLQSRALHLAARDPRTPWYVIPPAVLMDCQASAAASPDKLPRSRTAAAVIIAVWLLATILRVITRYDWFESCGGSLKA